MAKNAFLFLFSKDAFLLLFLGMLLVAMFWEARHKLKDWNLIFRNKVVRIYTRNWTKFLLGIVGVVERFQIETDRSKSYDPATWLCPASKIIPKFYMGARSFDVETAQALRGRST